MSKLFDRAPPHDHIARCRKCGETIGYRLGDSPGVIARIAHMQESHPIRRAFAYLVAPFLRGDLLYYPVDWVYVGHRES